MSDLEDLRAAEAEREAREAQARRQWQSMDWRESKDKMANMDFPDEWLEEAESQCAAGYWRSK